MSAHSKSEYTTEATYDERGQVGPAQRVIITKAVRNWPAFFAMTGALVSFVIFTWFMVILVIPAAALGYLISQTQVREGKWCSIAAMILIVLAIAKHI